LTQVNPPQRKPGRPRAIPPSLLPEVFSLYRQGLGYRRIANELEAYGISANWSSVRRAIKNTMTPASQQKHTPHAF
jgi:hypothetical protein